MQTHFYRLCGLGLVTDFVCPELAEQRGDDFDLSCWMHREHHIEAEGRHSVIHEWRFPDGSPWLSISKAGTEYILTFCDLGTFFVSSDAKEVFCRPTDGTPSDTVRHLFLDQVVPLLLSAWGKLVLHASGVAGPDGTLAFIGVAGAGKSTMAASFLADGYKVLTDDCLIIEPDNASFTVRANYPGLRLWPDTAAAVLGEGLATSDVAHYTRKRRVVAAQEQPEVVPLRRLYLLAEPEPDSAAIAIETLPPAEAFIELVKYTFRLDVSDRKKLAEEFGPFSRLVSSGYVKRLRYPRDLSTLSQVKDAILLDAARDKRPVARLSEP
jgi:hypothetical protein